MKDVYDFPELKVLKRLTCFEEICPSNKVTAAPRLLSKYALKFGVEGLSDNERVLSASL